MNGKINKQGGLEIMRGGKWEYVRCSGLLRAQCTSRCSQFDKPEQIEVETIKPRKTTIKIKTCVRTCNQVFEFDEFTDEIGKK